MKLKAKIQKKKCKEMRVCFLKDNMQLQLLKNKNQLLKNLQHLSSRKRNNNCCFFWMKKHIYAVSGNRNRVPWFLVRCSNHCTITTTLLLTKQSMSLVFSIGFPGVFFIQEQDKHRIIREWFTSYQLITNNIFVSTRLEIQRWSH